MGKYDGKLMSHLFIFGTILFTVYGQLVLKWQMSTVPPFPADPVERASFLLGLVVRPWILSCLAAGFFAFLCWAAALRGLELSYAYPYMGASFVLVLWFSAVFFQEPITATKLLGTALIVAGIAVGSQG